ncbi:MAG: TlpA family protein disulfide reductase, partial [Planctomycetaceae bacterium]
VREHARRTLRDVDGYLARHPDAPDAERAWRWLFTTAREHRLEAEVLAAAERYLSAQRDEDDAALAALARQVRCLALARTGKWEAALQCLDEHLRTVRLRSAGESVELALSLAAEAQLDGEMEAARAALERLNQAFLLNASVREITESRLTRLGLADEPAPKLALEDLDGQAIDLADFRGQVVLIDFWATNCAPCLAELPALKQLHSEHRDRGFAVIGISLDEERAVVEEFRETHKIPWRLALSNQDENATQERYRVRTIPATFLVDRAGRVRYVDLHGEDLREAVERLLEENREAE